MIRIALLLILFVFSLQAKEVFFSVDNTAYIWKKIQVTQLQDAFSTRKGINFTYASGEGDIAKQVKDIEGAIEKGVDLLIVSPVDAQVIASVVEKAYDSGIKIIFAIRSANTQKFHTYIHPDDKIIAQNAAKYILQTRKNPKIVMIQGRVGANTVTNRKEGFLQVIENAPDAQMAAIKVGNYKPDEALAVMDEIISQGVEFNAVYTHNDAMQEGVRIALETNNIDYNDVTLVGIDYISQAQEAIKQGKMDATFTYPTSVDVIVESAIALLEGKTVKKDIVVPSVLITKDNVDAIAPLF
jgi:ribose transport system substrate-binding protein